MLILTNVLLFSPGAAVNFVLVMGIVAMALVGMVWDVGVRYVFGLATVFVLVQTILAWRLIAMRHAQQIDKII